MTWASTTLGACGSWVSGGTPSTSNPDYWGGDIPWISSKSLTNFHVSDSDRRLTPLGACNGTKIVPRNSILMVVRGMSLKTEFRMGITRRDVALSQDLKALLPSGLFDPLFLAYALKARSGDVLDMVDEAGHGTGRLQSDRLFALEIPAPPIPEQRSIATALGALDEKIQSNQRIIKLENDLAITMLSEGSGGVEVGEVATVTKGLSYKGSGLGDASSTRAVPMLNLGNFTTSGQFKDEATKYYTGDFKPNHVLGAYELVVANTDLTQAREVLGRGFIVPPRLAGAIHTHHTFVIRFGREPWMAWFLWAQLQSRHFRDRAMGFATGTTVTALPLEVLLDYELRLPKDPQEVLESARSLVEHTWALEAENGRLEKLRDALLPELLSGRVRVPEAEQAMQEAIA